MGMRGVITFLPLRATTCRRLGITHYPLHRPGALAHRLGLAPAGRAALHPNGATTVGLVGKARVGKVVAQAGRVGGHVVVMAEEGVGTADDAGQRLTL